MAMVILCANFGHFMRKPTITIGIEDIALIHWAETSFRTERLFFVEVLRELDGKYQLVV